MSENHSFSLFFEHCLQSQNLPTGTFNLISLRKFLWPAFGIQPQFPKSKKTQCCLIDFLQNIRKLNVFAMFWKRELPLLIEPAKCERGFETRGGRALDATRAGSTPNALDTKLGARTRSARTEPERRFVCQRR